MAPTTVFKRTQKMNEVRRTKGSSLNRSQQLKPFCKICFDTGKTEEMYDSHFVRETRDPNSRIVCPTLLAMECRFCFARGHTVSKCPKLDKVKSGENGRMEFVVMNSHLARRMGFHCCIRMMMTMLTLWMSLRRHPKFSLA